MPQNLKFSLREWWAFSRHRSHCGKVTLPKSYGLLGQTENQGSTTSVLKHELRDPKEVRYDEVFNPPIRVDGHVALLLFIGVMVSAIWTGGILIEHLAIPGRQGKG
jgi:hypothetical protein